MKITADSAKRNSHKTHALFEGRPAVAFRNGEFCIYARTEVLSSTLHGTYSIKITLSSQELHALADTEITNLRSQLQRLEASLQKGV